MQPHGGVVQIRVLGPIELWSSGAALAIGGPKQRAVLALLLARAGTLLPVDDIVAELWDDRPPPSAGANARMYANNLRRLLAGRADAAVLSRVGDGYRLDLNGAETDLSEFRRWVTDARQRSTAGDPATAVSRFDAALDLWRGPPVSDVPAGRLLSRWRVTVTEERWSAVEDRADALLRLGGHERVSADMRDLLTAEPLRERAHALLARARYQAGDVAGALAVLDDARRVLAEELGVEPGDELRELHKAVLNRDPGVARSARPAVPASRSAPVPRQLPAGVAGFTGRREFLRRLDAHLPDGRSAAAPATVLITAIDGTAGVGKTCLAVHWARRVAGRFPDGQLYVNLRGFDAAPPMAPEDALRRFLDALGVPARQVPQDVEAQAALYRSLLADRRMLVVLDNARDAEQVRPLLPGSTGCLALITSRSRLTPLVVTSGADTMTLDVLSEREAHDLLARRLGAERVAAEPDAVDSIVAACGRLPLALAVVAARAAQGGVPLGGLAAELRPAGGRSLDALDGGDLATRVRAVFSWSYAALDAPAARLFRLLGGLVGASLLGEPVPGRFALHDLLRTYAAELATTVDSEAERHDALRRLLDHYTHTAHA
ncbi:MAG TPA: BTAD domain-containing putative transcriptional regulator, partial [Micromonosporaceae bacterium]|nr:BTAD domain-containing putative transcriptional regulator [Micromonosporaceae bacterium]